MTQDEQKALGGILRLIKEGREDPRIYEVTRQVISQSGTRFGYDIDELEALYQFIQGRVRYVRDPYGKDTYQGAVDTLDKFKTGDCEDLTILLASMVLTVGYPVALKLASIGGEIWDHIYPLAGMPPQEPEKWVAMDATLIYGRLGQEPERAYEKMFKITNGLVSETGEIYQPSGDWQEKVLKWLPLIIIAPFAVFFVKETMSRR